MQITNDIVYVGVDDHQTDLFEGQYDVRERGMSYNSYVILDEKIAVTDTVDGRFVDEWLANVEAALADRTPSYLIVHHMEPDHSAGIKVFLEHYPEAQVVATAGAFKMMDAYFGCDYADRRIVAKQGASLELGAHTLSFVLAPNVHWPEVMFSFDEADGVLFSADAFGTFGALDSPADDWTCDARRYYIGIVGKFGKFVQTALGKAAGLDIKVIAPLHGPILTSNLSYYLGLYNTWSSYVPEAKGVTVAYSSVYGHTKEAALLLADMLRESGSEVALYDLARDDMSFAVADAFRYDRLVLATTTYCGGVFPCMETFMAALAERNFQKRSVALIENGSWAPAAAKLMRAHLDALQNIELVEPVVTIKGSVDDATREQLTQLAEALA